MATTTIEKPRSLAIVAAFSYNDIVTQDEQNVLMTWRDVFRAGQFEIGDIVLGIINRSMRSGTYIDREQIYKAVGHFCGKTPRTVRSYYETAVFFDKSVRDEFDMLSFSHYVAARLFGDRWREVLEYAAENTCKSADAVKAHFLSKELDDDQSPDDNDAKVHTSNDPPSVPKGHKRRGDSCESSQQVPGRAINHMRASEITGAVGVLDRLAKLIEGNDKIRDEVKSECIGALGVLKKHLPELAKMVV